MKKRKRKKGGGRKKGEPTKVVRIPLAIAPDVYQMIENRKVKTIHPMP